VKLKIKTNKHIEYIYNAHNMKTRILFVWLFLSCVICSAENEKIPVWVKNVTSPKEYAIWQKLSSFYKIDFNKQQVLKQARLMNEEIRKQTYDILRAEGQKIDEKKKNGEKDGGVLEIGFPLPPAQPYSIVENNGNTILKSLVFSSVDGYDAHLEFTAEYDTANKQIHNVSVRPLSFSHLKVDYLNPMLDDQLKRVQYVPDMKAFNGSFTGILSYTLPDGTTKKETVKTGALIKIE